MRFRYSLIFIYLLLISPASWAQYYDTGQDPAGLKWLQIKTDKFRVIYPETYGSAGIDFARSLDEAYTSLTTFFPGKRFKIPVIIHNYTTQSNGYVSWAPRRMEIYPTPEQNTIPLDHNKQLAIHELTHVFQMESLNKGFSGAMSLLLGEQFPGVVAALLPVWYLEGKAVLTESILTESGRGRSAAFQKELKAITLEKGRMYKYDRMVNGSFRIHVPDHYQSGFQAVTWAYLNYDKEIWNKVLRTTSNGPFLLDPVNLSLLRSAGITKRQLYRETFDTLKAIWTEENNRNGSHLYEPVNPSRKSKYAGYYSPVLADGKIAAVKTTLYNPPRFVLIDPADKSEKKIHVPGRIYPYFISASQSKLAWVESRNDPRWNNRNYSVIKTIDLRDSRVRQLSRRTRYMSVAISPDGMTMAVTENTIDNLNNLVLLNAETGKETGSYPAPDNIYLQRPQWSDDGSRLTLICLTDNGEGIMSFTPSEKRWEILIEAEPVDYQSSFLRHDSLFFVSSSTGNENIFVLSPDKKITALTNAVAGATDPVFDGSRIIFCDYTSAGNNISQTRIGAVAEIPRSPDSSPFLIDRIDLEIPAHSEKPDYTYRPERYRKWKHPFRFHSWMPFYADLDELRADPMSVRPGFTIMSQNHLSTLITTLGYEYSDQRHMFHSRITWLGWYPVVESRIDYGDPAQIFKLGERVDNPVTVNPGILMTNRIYVPLRFSTGKYLQYLQPSISSTYRNNYIYSREENLYDYGQTQLSARLYFNNYHRYALRDIYPRFAQIVDVNYSVYPFDSDIYGDFLTLRTALYLPGLFPNNGLRLRYETDNQVVEKIPLRNRINFPRSYNNIVSEVLHFFSADYVAPLLYPDLNISSLVYITRIRADLFYDYARGTRNYYSNIVNGERVYNEFHNYTETFSSYGVELMADFYVLRLPFMVSAGAQAAWRNIKEFPSLEFLFTIDIYGMSIGKRRM